MVERIPDLWRAGEDARRLYTLYICRLDSNGLHARVVAACRKIRRYAARRPGAEEGMFTFPFEIDALIELKDFRGAWRQLRRREVLLFGERLDLARREWSGPDAWELAFSYAPLLYFLGRYQAGCDLLETALGLWGRGKLHSFERLHHVYNGSVEPRHRCGVTLAHFYARLGKDLRDWPLWEKFVKGFHPRLFRLARVRREALLQDPARLGGFVDRLHAVLRERGGGWEQADLLDSPKKVRARRRAREEEMEAFKETMRPRMERTEAKLRELFPELRELAGGPTR
jgi:hypothetical protein